MGDVVVSEAVVPVKKKYPGTTIFARKETFAEFYKAFGKVDGETADAFLVRITKAKLASEIPVDFSPQVAGNG